MGEPQSKPEKVSGWVKAFVAFHLVAITVWALPVAPRGYARGSARLEVRTDSVGAFLSSSIRSASDAVLLLNQDFGKTSPIKYYLGPTGWWQYWDMFSPNPARADIWGSMVVTYQDGTSKPFPYPRMAELGLVDKYLKERYRKFYERAHLERNQWYWPTFAQRIALLAADDPKNLPVRVKLTRHFYELPQAGGPTPTAYKTFTYYDHPVNLDQLRRDLGPPAPWSLILMKPPIDARILPVDARLGKEGSGGG